MVRPGKAEPSRRPNLVRGCRSPALTLPRHLYRTILRLLRPVESAVRRLIIVAARGLVVEPPPAPHDPIDATRIARRLAVLVRVLDDLPGQALRFARWRAAREAEALRAKTLGAQQGRGARRFQRSWPLRPGLPPGQTLATHRRPRHELHELLRNLQSLACWALERTDTS